MSSFGERYAEEQDFTEPDTQDPDDLQRDEQKPKCQDLEVKAEHRPHFDSMEQHGKAHHIKDRADQEPDAQLLNTQERDAQDLRTLHDVKSDAQERYAPKLGSRGRNVQPCASHPLTQRPYALDRDTREHLTQERDTRERELLCKQFVQMQLDKARHSRERLAPGPESVGREPVHIACPSSDLQPRGKHFPDQQLLLAQEPGVVRTDRRQGGNPLERHIQQVERYIQYRERTTGVARAIQQCEQQLQQRKELNEQQKRDVLQQDVVQEDVQQRERVVEEREIAVEKWQMKVHQRERIVERRERTVELREGMVEQREKAVLDKEVMHLQQEQETCSNSESGKTQGPE
eukprot:scpid79568/ scgid5521/ 